MSDKEYCESEFYYPEADNEGYETVKPFFVSLTNYSTIIWFIREYCLSSFRNAHMPYNKELTDFDCSGCMGYSQ